MEKYSDRYCDEDGEVQPSSAPLPTYHARSPIAQNNVHSRKRRLFSILYLMVWGYLAFRAFTGVKTFIQGVNKTEMSITSDIPIPPGISIDRCVAWKEPEHREPGQGHRYEDHSSFELPLSSNTLFLISQGYKSVGSVHVVQDNDIEDNIRVDVVTKYVYFEELEHVKVCLVHRNEGENGVGIFSPTWSDNPDRKHQHFYFEVTVRLPKTQDQPLHIPNFETSMVLFKHWIGDLAKVVEFDSISITTAIAPIFVESISAKSGNFVSSVGPIDGTFDVSSSLSLITATAPIRANVSLSTDGSEAAKLNMVTSAASIEALAILRSTKGTGGEFNINAKTSLGKVDIKFLDAPVDSTLLLDAETSIGPASVELHKTYQGTFSVRSSLVRPTVQFDSNTEDPAGKGRSRTIRFNEKGRNNIRGKVFWSSEDDGVAGDVQLRTSIASAVLRL